PVLGLVAAVLARDAERPLGHAGGALLWRIEDREMLADDFVGGVALDTLRAGIPIADIAVAIEHADRVVGDAFDQQSELALAFEQLVCGGFFRRDVAADDI